MVKSRQDSEAEEHSGLGEGEMRTLNFTQREMGSLEDTFAKYPWGALENRCCEGWEEAGGADTKLL